MNAKNRVSGKMCGILFLVLVSLIGMAGQTFAQMRLQDLVRQEGFEWMIGTWTATTDDGQSIEVEYSWQLDGWMIAIDFRIGEYSYRGMIFRIENRDQVVEAGCDNQGTSVMGSWDIVDNRAISTTERSNANGQVQTMSISHRKAGMNGMSVELFNVENGQTDSTPWGTLEFQRRDIPEKRMDSAKVSVKEAPAENDFAVDVIQKAKSEVKITLIGHGTLMLSYAGKIIHVDPWSNLADYSKMPKADVILITHEHRDHLDPKAVKIVSKEGTDILLTSACKASVPMGIVVKNGDVKQVQGIRIEAVPAYNIVNKRPGGEPYHPKGQGNGYILTLGDIRVYIAADTENTPEMKELKGIDVAFLPMNLPYTMTPEMVADAARALKPKVLYPYHFGQTDTGKLIELLKDSQDIQVRIHKMQ